MNAKPHDLLGELRADYAYEATVVELIDRVEAQSHELDGLRTEAGEARRERDALKAELVMAQGYLRELARALEDAEARLAAHASSLRSRIAPPGE